MASHQRAAGAAAAGATRLRYRPSSDTNKLSPNASNRRCSRPAVRLGRRAHNEMLPTSLPHQLLRLLQRCAGCDQQTQWFMRRPGVEPVSTDGRTPVAGPGTALHARTDAGGHQCNDAYQRIFAESDAA